MDRMKDFLASKQGITFLALFVTLLLGIVIGTVVSDRVLSAEETRTAGAATLKLASGSSSLLTDEATSLAEGFRRVAKAVEPTVVNISTTAVIQARSPQQSTPDELRDFFGPEWFERFFGPLPQQRRATSLGSGVIVDPEGYILTNFHVVAPVIEDGQDGEVNGKIEVTLPSGEIFRPEVIGQDPESDMVVLKIDASKELPAAKIGDSSDMQVGDWVLAIGNPFGLHQTVTAGIISATGRVVESGEMPLFSDYLQTDAAINPGNSGGPLVNMRGEVVGLNTFIYTRSGGSQGVGFAVPSAVFTNTYNQIVTKGHVTRGWLGVTMNRTPVGEGHLTPEMAKFFGVSGDDPQGVKDGDGVVIVETVSENGDSCECGPAYEAGIRAEDVIVKFGNKEVEMIPDLRFAVANTPPGEKVPVTIVRKGEVKTLTVELAERTFERERRAENRGLSFEERERRERQKEIGIEFETLSAREAERLRVEGVEGVLVRSITPGSRADEAGLIAGMIITHANGKPMRTGEEFKQEVSGLPSGSAVVLRVVVKPPQAERAQVFYTSFVKP